MASNRNSLGVGAFLLLVLLGIGIFFFNAWLLMLLLGAVHSGWASVPALSYWTSVLVTLLLAFIGGYFKQRNTA